MPRPRKITDGQVYREITMFLAEHGYGPTMGELRDRLNVGSTGTIFRRIASLRERGLLRDYPRGGARSVDVVSSWAAPLRQVLEVLKEHDDQRIRKAREMIREYYVENLERMIREV